MDQDNKPESASDYAVLHEISVFGMHENVDAVVNEALEKAARLFRVRCFAITLDHQTHTEVVLSWGFRSQDEVFEKISLDHPNRFRYKFSGGGMLFMELPYAYDDRENRFYTIFSRHVDRAFQHAKAVTEQKREEELRKHKERILATLATEKPLEEILQLIVDSLESEEADSRAMIMLVDQQQKELVHGVVPDAFRECVNSIPIKNGAGSCGTAAFKRERVIVEDVRTHPYWQNHLDEAERINLKACWSEPVLSASGNILATLAVFYPYPKKPDNDHLERLKTLANLTSIAIERKRSEKQLHQSLKEKEMLLQEVHHRVKNNLALISGFLELQAGINKNPDFTEAVKDSQARIRSMALVHDQLHKVDVISSFRFDHYLTQLVKDISSSFKDSSSSIELDINVEPVNLCIDQAIHCGILVNEMITNTYKHAFRDRKTGSLQVRLFSQGDQIVISVKDDGKGIPKDIFERQNKESLGIRIMRNLIWQLDAEYDIDNNNGTQITIRFPAQK